MLYIKIQNKILETIQFDDDVVLLNIKIQKRKTLLWCCILEFEKRVVLSISKIECRFLKTSKRCYQMTICCSFFSMMN